MNEIFQWKMLSAEQNFDPADRPGATGGHGFTFFGNRSTFFKELAIAVISIYIIYTFRSSILRM